MNTLQEAEKLISQLAPEDLASFRRWFAEFDAEQWDRQFKEDVAAGKLDRLAPIQNTIASCEVDQDFGVS
jgi:hypothetical protein